MKIKSNGNFESMLSLRVVFFIVNQRTCAGGTIRIYQDICQSVRTTLIQSILNTVPSASVTVNFALRNG